jgi:hypothetical protein
MSQKNELHIAADIFKLFLDNAQVRRELPMAVAIAQRFVEFHDQEMSQKAALGRFTLQQKSPDELKRELLAAMKSNDWLKAADCCKRLHLASLARKSNDAEV